MDKLKILLNQIESDLQELYLDVNSGLYEKNVEGFLKEMERIGKKLREAKDLREDENEIVPKKIEGMLNDLDKIRADEAKVDELKQERALEEMSPKDSPAFYAE